MSISLSTASRLSPSIIQRSIVNVHTLKLDVPEEKELKIEQYATQLTKLRHLHIEYFDEGIIRGVEQLLETFPMLTSLTCIQRRSGGSLEKIPPLLWVRSPVLTSLTL